MFFFRKNLMTCKLFQTRKNVKKALKMGRNNFEYCTFEKGLSLEEMDFSNFIFWKASLIEANLSRADLKGANADFSSNQSHKS